MEQKERHFEPPGKNEEDIYEALKKSDFMNHPSKYLMWVHKEVISFNIVTTSTNTSKVITTVFPYFIMCSKVFP